MSPGLLFQMAGWVPAIAWGAYADSLLSALIGGAVIAAVFLAIRLAIFE